MNKKARIKLIEEDIFKCIIPLSPEAAVQAIPEVIPEVTPEVAGEATNYQ